MPNSPYRRPKQMSEADYLQHKRRVVAERFEKGLRELGLDHLPTAKELSRYPSLPGYSTIRTYFKGYKDLLQYLGIDLETYQRERWGTPNRRDPLNPTGARDKYARRWNKSTIFQAIKDWGRVHQRAPREEDFEYDDALPSVRTVKSKFRTSVKAVVARAGLKVVLYEQPAMRARLREKIYQYGHVPTTKELDRDPEIAGREAYIKHFGSWEQAVRAAVQDDTTALARFILQATPRDWAYHARYGKLPQSSAPC